jgi:N-acetylneuraminic acid mutarotase
VAESESVSVGGKLYVFGGYNVSSPDFQATTATQAYDPSTNTWARLASMPVAETQMGVASDGKYIYVAGGYTYNPATTWQKFGTTNDFRYDIATNTWSSFVPLPAARGAGAMVILNNQLHYFDGVDTSRVSQNEHWVLDLGNANPQWTTAASVPLARNHITAAVLNGKIYAIGGQTTSDDSTTDSQVFVWNPANPSTWTSVASLPFSFSHAVAAVVDGEIVIAGGEKANDVPIASVLAYDPSTNTWKTEASLPGARLSPAGGVVGNQLVITTGFANGGFTSTTWVAQI